MLAILAGLRKSLENIWWRKNLPAANPVLGVLRDFCEIWQTDAWMHQINPGDFGLVLFLSVQVLMNDFFPSSGLVAASEGN